MKRRIRIKRKDGIRQRYWVGKKPRKNYGATIDSLLRRDIPTLRNELTIRYGIPPHVTERMSKVELINLSRRKDLEYLKQLKTSKIKNLLKLREEESAEGDGRKILKQHKREELLRQLERLQEDNNGGYPS